MLTAKELDALRLICADYDWPDINKHIFKRKNADGEVPVPISTLASLLQVVLILPELLRGRQDVLLETLRKLYDAEINAGISSFWDGGYTVWIGDIHNGKKSERPFSRGAAASDYKSWEELWCAASGWLLSEAERHYPGWDKQ